MLHTLVYNIRRELDLKDDNGIENLRCSQVFKYEHAFRAVVFKARR